MTSVADRVRLVRDTIFNMVPPVASALMGLLTVAAQLRFLPRADYGLWIGMHAIIATASIIDFGIGWTITWTVGADPNAEKNATLELLAGASASLIVLALAGGVLVFLFALATARSFGLPESSLRLELPAAAAAAAIYGANRITLFAQSVFTGQRRFEIVGALAAAQTIMIGLGTIYFSYLTHDVVSIAATHAGIAVCFMAFSLAIVPTPFRPRLKSLRGISRIGGFATASQMADLSLTAVWECGALVIGYIAGAASVVPFHVGMRIPKTFGTILVRAAEVMMPVGANIAAHGDSRVDRKIVLDGVRWNLIKAIPVTLALSLLSPALLLLWLHRVDPEILMVQRIALFAVLLDAAGNGILYFLWGRGAIRQILIACIAKALLGLALTALFVTVIGPVGAALALLASLGAVALWLSTQIPAILPRPRSGFAAISAGFYMPALLSALTIFISRQFFIGHPWAELIAGGGLGVAVFLSAFLISGAHDEERHLAAALLRPLRDRLKAIRPLRSLWHFAIELELRLRGDWRRGLADTQSLFESATDPWAYREPRHQSRLARAEAMVRMARDLSGGRLDRVLELACAEGHFTERLVGLAAHVTALDGSALALARNRVRLAAASGLDYLERDIVADPLPGGFDLVIADGILDYFRSRAALAALRRKLKDCVRPGGFLLLGNVRQHEIIETARWARWLVRGAVNVNEFVAAEPGFEMIAADVDDFYAYHLVHRL